jgi:hypothetical protein
LSSSDELLFEHRLSTRDHIFARREREIILNTVNLALNRCKELGSYLYQALNVIVQWTDLELTVH